MTARIRLIVLSILLAGVPATGDDIPGEGSGSICLAPVNDSFSPIDAETGNRRGYVSYRLNVRIDKGPWVEIPAEKPYLITGVPLKEQHLVSIREDERLIESFWFTFDGRGGADLCLSYKPWYQTWLLEPPKKRPRCRCAA